MQGEEDKKRVGDEIKPVYKKEGTLGRLKRGMYSRLNQPVTRPRRNLSGVQPHTKGDWDVTKTGENLEESKIPVAPRHRDEKSNKSLTLGVVIAAVFALVSLLGALIYIVGGAGLISSGRVQINVLGPHSIVGGSILELNIEVTNNNSKDLELADLIVRYPEGTRVPRDLATDMTVQRIPLGGIPSGATRTGTVRAAVFGMSGEDKEVVVEIEYRVAGSNALVVSRGLHNILISSNSLDITVDTNEEAVAGQDLDMVVNVVSRSDIVLRDVVLFAEYPFGFEPDSFDKDPKSGNDFWEVGDLAPGEKYSLRLSGKLSGQSGDTRIVRFSSGFREDKNSEEIIATLATLEQEVNLKTAFLDIRILFDDSQEEYVGHSGTTIQVDILWKNNLPVALSNVVLAASIYGEGVDPYTISANKGFYRSRDSVALWNKTTTNGDFETIAAGEEGSVSLNITPRVLEQLASTREPEINIEIHAAGQRLSETGVPETLQSTVQKKIKIASDVELSSQALYYTNPFESNGPLPPRVHQETTYAVMWEVKNTTSTVRDATVTAALPPYMQWMRLVSPVAENIVYNQSESTLTWYLGTLLPETGYGENEPRRVAFNLSFVPSAGQVGSSPELIINQEFKGVDIFIDSEITTVADDVTTDLKEEEFRTEEAAVLP